MKREKKKFPLLFLFTKIHLKIIPKTVKTIPEYYSSISGEGWYSVVLSSPVTFYVESGVDKSQWPDRWNARGFNGSNRAPVNWNLTIPTGKPVGF